MNGKVRTWGNTSMVMLAVSGALFGCHVQQQEGGADQIGDTQTYQVEAEIAGLRNANGVIISVLCVDGEAFPNQCEQRTRVDAAADPVILKYSVPRGEYALAAFHDEDDNGQINAGPYGLPSEGVAFSNDVMAPTGPPTFEMARFKVDGDTRIRVKMIYFQ